MLHLRLSEVFCIGLANDNDANQTGCLMNMFVDRSPAFFQPYMSRVKSPSPILSPDFFGDKVPGKKFMISIPAIASITIKLNKDFKNVRTRLILLSGTVASLIAAKMIRLL